MINLETLKKDIHQREKKKLLRNFIFGNILIVLFISVTISGTKVTEREKELIAMNREISYERDSLKNLVINELVLLKNNENKLIRKSLSMSVDTNYVDDQFNVNDFYTYAESQKNTYINIENIVDNKWDSISRVPTGMPITLSDMDYYTDGC